jgi:peptidoglycan/xylan/chitin deacetylase (PgdA/CDA1 family)
MTFYPDALMYHYVRERTTQPVVGYPAVRPVDFRAQLDDACRLTTPVGWPEVRAAIEGRSSLPADALLLTFDDGLIDHHRTVGPELAARGLRAIFFAMAREPRDGLTLGHRLHVLLGVMSPPQLGAAIAERLPPETARSYLAQVEVARAAAATAPAPTADLADPWKRPVQRDLGPIAGPVLGDLIRERLGAEDELARELYMGPRELAELVAAGHTIGGHGRDHHWLDVVDAGARRSEIAASAALAAGYSLGPWPFAYPYGGVPPRPGALLGRAGFAAAFTTRAGERRGPHRIGRRDADDLPTATSG